MSAHWSRVSGSEGRGMVIGELAMISLCALSGRVRSTRGTWQRISMDDLALQN